MAVAVCIDALPSTAENPNEDAYQRGRFDGVMEYQAALYKIMDNYDENAK